MLINKQPDESEVLISDVTKKESIANTPVTFAAAGVLFFGLMVYIGGFVGTFVDMGAEIVTISEMNAFKVAANAFITKTGLSIVGLAIAVLLIFGVFLLKRNGTLGGVKGSDKRGVDYSETGTYGTAEWMDRKQAETVFEVADISAAEGTILAQFSEDGKETICLPEWTERNKNILILGSPGTGKSWCFVRNAIFQACVRNESMVITDPKGELYESTSEVLRNEGYDVKVFNLVNPQRSDAWNCTNEIYDPETFDVSEIRINEFADAVMRNTLEGKDDHFWGLGEQNLFKAIIAFCAWNREQNIKETIYVHARRFADNIRVEKANGNLSDAVISENDINQLIRICDTKLLDPVTMRERENALRTLKYVLGGTKEEADEIIERIKNEAPKCDMSSIYFTLVTKKLDDLEKMFTPVPVYHPAAIAWSIFKNGGEKTGPGFVQGLSQRLQLFQMRDIRRITTNDDINFKSLGDKKTAIFCIISDKSIAMRAITSLFFHFMFKDVSDAADALGPKTRIPVNVICDEFANLGVLPNFERTISTVRSRKIYIYMILQSVLQLAQNYEDEAKETIIGCCDTILFLGCNDSTTASFISDLSGVASIKVSTTKDDKLSALGNRGILQGYQVSEGDGKRNILNPDEVRRLPRSKVIIYHNGCNILEAFRCSFECHPYFKQGLPPEAHLSDYELASKKYALTEATDSFYNANVINAQKEAEKAVQAAKNASVPKGQVNRKTPLDGQESLVGSGNDFLI